MFMNQTNQDFEVISSDVTPIQNDFIEKSFSQDSSFLSSPDAPALPIIYGKWRLDKPKIPGFSHELIHPDTLKILDKTNLDELKAVPFDGVDTALKAFRRNVFRIPNENYFGTRDGKEYKW
jgi:hypothetical protein